MANNYLQFSEMIENISNTEMEWWKNKLAALESLEDQEEKTDEQEDLMYAASNFELEADSVWVVARESGNLDAVASIVQDFLVECRPKECFALTWACTCDKMRVGEFGGGGVFITARKPYFVNPYETIAEMKQRFLETSK